MGVTNVEVVKDVEVTELSGEKVMIDFSRGRYFMIKGAGNDIWDMLESARRQKKRISIEDIVRMLMDIYEVDENVCRKSVDIFLKSMQDNGFVELNRG